MTNRAAILVVVLLAAIVAAMFAWPRYQFATMLHELKVEEVVSATVQTIMTKEEMFSGKPSPGHPVIEVREPKAFAREFVIRMKSGATRYKANDACSCTPEYEVHIMTQSDRFEIRVSETGRSANIWGSIKGNVQFSEAGVAGVVQLIHDQERKLTAD